MNIQEQLNKAAADWPLSLRDDPTAFEPSDTWLSVTDKVNAAIRENARSAISRGLGKILDDVAVACDVELEENGGLADLDSVIARFVPGLEVDTAPLYEAADWTARVAALRQSFGLAVAGLTVPTVSGAALRDFVAGEPRLPHLGTPGPAVFADDYSDKGGPVTVRVAGLQDISIDDFKPPAFVTKPFEARAAAPVEDGWDDEPDTAATPAPVETAKSDAPASLIAIIAAHLSELGVKDADLAAALGISRTYLSLMRKGERTWAPATEARLDALRAIAEHKANVAQEAIYQAVAP